MKVERRGTEDETVSYDYGASTGRAEGGAAVWLRGCPGSDDGKGQAVS